MALTEYGDEDEENGGDGVGGCHCFSGWLL